MTRRKSHTTQEGHLYSDHTHARDVAFFDCPLLLRPVVPFRDRFFAVLADALKSFLLGAPFAPGLRIFSLLPLAMRFRFALMLA